MSMSGDKTIHNRINPKSGRIIYLLGFIVLLLVSFLPYLLIPSFDSLWVIMLVIVSVFGIAWQIDMLMKRAEISKLNASTVGEVLSVHEVVDVEYGGFSPSKYFINSIELKFDVEGREINLRVSVNKSVYDRIQPDMPVTIYYASKNPRIALLEVEL